MLTVSFPAPGSRESTRRTASALQEVQGQRVAAFCEEYVEQPATARSVGRGTWPAGAFSFAITLSADISSTVLDCLFEAGPRGRDVAAANFSGRLVVTSRVVVRNTGTWT